MVFRAAIANPEVEVKAVNDLLLLEISEVIHEDFLQQYGSPCARQRCS